MIYSGMIQCGDSSLRLKTQISFRVAGKYKIIFNTFINFKQFVENMINIFEKVNRFYIYYREKYFLRIYYSKRTIPSGR